jgi:hypothetical protein
VGARAGYCGVKFSFSFLPHLEFSTMARWKEEQGQSSSNDIQIRADPTHTKPPLDM